ncbi:tail fiber protein [Pseudomonas yamanorum]|nr:tail fiber protein [Pseudomonas yamanorum]
MQKISDSTNTANPAGEFTEGNPAAGAPATLLKAPWLNAIQRELVGVVLGAGISLNASDDTQVLKAIKALAGTAADFNKLSNKPTTLGGYGITDGATKTELAGKQAALGFVPLQQGTGVGQSNNVIKVGWSNDSNAQLKVTVDAVDQGHFWLSSNFNPAMKADKATTLGGYGITDGATKTELAGRQAALGFAPVQQGTGVGQSTNVIKVGWSNDGTSKLRVSVDSSDQGYFWLSTNFDPATKANKATTLGGYGITDGATKIELNAGLAGKQAALGFAPVQQGGGVGQSNNVIKIGWSNDSNAQLKVTVDDTDQGAIWCESSFDAVGAVLHFPFGSAPRGFLKANGAAVSRTIYAKLFTKIGTAYGVGDGSTTFNLPDLRGEFIRGLDDGRGIDSGRGVGSFQLGAIEAHTHAIYATGNNPSYGRQGTGSGPGDYAAQTASTGTTETRPRNVALLACIKY